MCGTFIVFLLSVLAKDNKLVRQRSHFSVPVYGTFTVFLLSDILQTYSVFVKDKRLTRQTHATTATMDDQSKADPGQIPEIRSECRWQLIDRIQDSLRELGYPNPGHSFGRGVLSSPEAPEVSSRVPVSGWP